MRFAALCLTLRLAALSTQEMISEEVEWSRQEDEIKAGLPVTLQFNTFYVAVENAKLSNKLSCAHEFEPKVDAYGREIETALEQCRRFVPRGHTQELRDCCVKLTQPILSDIQAKLLFIQSCDT